MSTRRYGWKRDLPDHRDHIFAAPHMDLVTAPPRIDLRAGCPSVYDQGSLGSCTGNAIAGALEFDRIKQHLDVWTPSRLFIYFNERVIERTVESDAGASIRDGIKSVNRSGACPEALHPYDVARFTERPSAQAFTVARAHPAVQYQRVPQSLSQLRAALAAGYPVVVGISVYDSFESDEVARTGIVPMPGAREDMLGGHAILCVGYDDATQRFLLRNSWGAGWAVAGYFTLPYAYLLSPDLASDFWQIRVTR